ncbi:MAG: Asp-tRNA(Asn)/Glu-tRNA(Gln) amidotransferase subunit GatA [Planctomycetes bacterium]|nr:Asp-tRNA(Asn)/Glu-tRNA(Gln) amidotransferase subunit GatA [Planctomycetota bacterium]
MADRVRRREVSALAVTEAHLARAAAVEPQVKAFLRVTADAARAEAQAIDARLARGEDPGPLCGVPVAVKDNLCTRGVETTAGSRILQGYVPPYDATVVERLRQAGAVTLGKANLDEFAMGSSTENSAFGPTTNPWDPSRVPGGSSGGSAAAVAAGEAPLALGSDTGGSIRQPAALCGCVGFKPTYGAVSRFGLIAFASSLDQVGPFARDCADAALLMDVLWGPDPRDMTARDPRDARVAGPLADLWAAPRPFSTAAAGASLEGVTLGVVKEYLELTTDAEVKGAVLAALDRARAAGASVREVSLGLTEFAIPTYQLVSTAEASSNLARYDGVHYGHRTKERVDVVGLYERSRAEGFGPEVRRRIFLGTFVLSSGFYDAYYLKGLRARRRIRDDFLRALDGVDALVGPTSPFPAFELGARAHDPLAMYAVDVFTVSTNMAGLPGLSLPCGFTSGPRPLPIGLQLTGRPWSDPRLLAIGRALEQALAGAGGAGGARRPEGLP